MMSQTDQTDNLNQNDIIPEEPEEEELDPRVQEELEKLNQHTDQINKLELKLEDANCLFRTLLTDSTHQLKALASKIGVVHIEKARPYFEAMEVATKAQKECQSAATAFQRASGIHDAARETIALAEQRFLSNSTHWQFDNAWQEMLNHATMKVMEAEKQKTDSEAEHLQRAAFYTAAEQACQRLEKRLKKHVEKTKPYFEQKDAFNRTLEAQKEQVQQLQSKVSIAKADYAKSLRKLEEISESIHAQRKFKQKLEQYREPGVGAEEHLKSLPSLSNLDVCGYKSSAASIDEYCERSTVSGQSSSRIDSDEDELDVATPPAPPTDSEHDKIVSRTMSCPEQMMKSLSLKESQS